MVPSPLVAVGDAGISDVEVREDVSVRWHSFSILGIEDEASRDGRPIE